MAGERDVGSLPVRLGLDLFSLRSQGLTPFAQLDFCARHGIEVVHFSEARLIGGLDPGHLLRVREYADRLGIALELGMLSICPSATIFNHAAGTAEGQVLQMLDAARIVGSPLIRCVVGSFRDRIAPGGIEARIADALAVLRNVRTRVIDAGLKLAIENHAGDMQARELKALVEAAGTDVAGVCLDSGNALWAMEDPRLTLDTLGPYVLTSHTRDTAVRRTENGIEVAWTPMGQGNIGIGGYLEAFQVACPGRPVMLEVIVMPTPKLFPIHDDNFWPAYRGMPAQEFQRFLDLVDRAAPAVLPSGEVDAEQERANVEESIRWTRAFLARPAGRAVH